MPMMLEEKLKPTFRDAKAMKGRLIADIETKQFVRINNVLCNMLGYSQQELLSMSVMDIHATKDLSRVLRAFQSLASGNREIVWNIPVLRKDGSRFFADVFARRLVYCNRPCVVGVFYQRPKNFVLEGKFTNFVLEGLHSVLESTRHIEMELCLKNVLGRLRRIDTKLSAIDN